MPKRKHAGESKRKAINAAFGQLGWHASGRDVMALLANYGIDVSEGLISKVRVDGLKKSGEAEQMRSRARANDRRQDHLKPRKVPQQRTYRR